MKKVISFTMAIAMLLSAVSCGEKKPEKSAEKQSYTTEKLSVTAYKKENLPVPNGMNMLFSAMVYNNGEDILMLGSGEKSPQFWQVSGDFSESVIVDFPEFDIGANYTITADNSGNVVTFLTHVEYGDLPYTADLYSLSEEEREEYLANAEYSFMIKTYTPDGELDKSIEVEDFGMEASATVNYQNIYTDGEFIIVEINGGYEMFDFNGKYLGEFMDENKNIDCIGQNKNGNIICAYTYKVDEEEKLAFKKINSDGTLSDISNTEYNFSETVYKIMPASGDYSLFLRTNTQIYGIKSDTEEIVPLLDISASGYSTNFIECCRVLPDGNMALVINDMNKYETYLKKFIPRTAEEMANIKTISLGVNGLYSDLENYITEWNESGNDFLVEIRNYDPDHSNDQKYFDQLKQEAVSGDLPDILCFQGNEQIMCNVDFAKMGALENLYTYIDNDDILSRDYFIPNLLNNLEYEGELLTLPNHFSLEVDDIAKTKFVGDGSDWNLKKQVEMTINPPIDRVIKDDSKYTRLNMVYWGKWIDFVNGTCNFTDDSFIRFIKWCNEAETVRYISDMTEEQWIKYLESDEYKQEHIKFSRRFIDDTEIISSGEIINRYSDYTQLLKGKFGGEPITILGDISLVGYDNMGITKSSENKEFAWEFIKNFIIDNENSNFPVTKNGVENHKKDSLNTLPHYTQEELKDYNGLLYSTGFDINDYIRIGNVTEEDIEAVDKLIESAQNERTINYPGMKLYEIHDEEFDRYFNDDCTAEECAESLQNRITIFLSEYKN